MTTIVYMGDRIIADTRASIHKKGFVSPNGDKSLYDEKCIKLEITKHDVEWDCHTEIDILGGSGTQQGCKNFTDFLYRLKVPLSDFLNSLATRESSLYKLIGLEASSTFILGLSNGEGVRIAINPRTFTVTGPTKKVLACGSGGFYFDATKDLFHTDPEILFRLASGVDEFSSTDKYQEGFYDFEARAWAIHKDIKTFDKPLDPEVLINSLHPNVKAMFKGTASEIKPSPKDKPTKGVASEKS